LQSSKERKDSKLQQQIVRNQDLLSQLEALNFELTKAKGDYESTLQMQ